MIKKNYLKEKLQNGKIVLGTWSIIPSPVVCDIIASSGLDFIIIDSEHGPINYTDAQNMTVACESRKVSPVMRVPGVSEFDIKKALDIGMHCIHVPDVKSCDDIKNIVQYSKFPPSGNRGFSPFTRAGEYSHLSNDNYTNHANKNSLVAIHLEEKKSLNNIEEFLDVDEIDIIFLGLFDISKSLNVPGQINHQLVTNLINETLIKINDHGKYAGTICTNVETMKNFIDIGFKYLTFSVDCEILKNSYQKVIEEFKNNFV